MKNNLQTLKEPFKFPIESGNLRRLLELHQRIEDFEAELREMAKGLEGNYILAKRTVIKEILGESE